MDMMGTIDMIELKDMADKLEITMVMDVIEVIE